MHTIDLRTMLLLASVTAAGCYSGDTSSAVADTDDAMSSGETLGESGTDDGGSDTGEDSLDDTLDPGRVTLRRLNATEYRNTLRDLFFGLDTDPTAAFPPDPKALGFDNVADVLTLSPVQFTLYERATDDLLLAALEGPANAEVSAQLIPCDTDDDACMRDTVETFAERAWRRPLTEDEIQTLLAEVDFALAEGSTAPQAVAAAFKRALLSVHFLFRVELDEEPTSDQAHLVGDFELASRLSYFIWSSMPDDKLFELAADGSLRDVAVIEAQVRRMLDDPRAAALQTNFAGQWLRTRGIEALTKEPSEFPDFDAALAADLATETSTFVGTFFTEDRPLTELLTAEETYINDRLAQHYGIDVSLTESFEWVSLQDTKRKGLLTQAGLMAMLAHEDKTAPTVRGAWVLSQLLCAAPPAPPADVPDLDESPGSGATARDRLERHATDPACAGCHVSMDPIGLALEKYNAAGAYRVAENGAPIDASGTLSGVDFDDALGMIDVLAADEERLSACVSQHLLTFALGRPFDGEDDSEHIGRAAETFTDGALRLQELVVAVALSDAFRGRRGEPQ